LRPRGDSLSTPCDDLVAVSSDEVIEHSAPFDESYASQANMVCLKLDSSGWEAGKPPWNPLSADLSLTGPSRFRPAPLRPLRVARPAGDGCADDERGAADDLAAGCPRGRHRGWTLTWCSKPTSVVYQSGQSLEAPPPVGGICQSRYSRRTQPIAAGRVSRQSVERRVLRVAMKSQRATSASNRASFR
jgi:hypothetical protein